jgi:hypothetical protein
MTKNCFSCRTEVEADSAFCRHCGKPLPQAPAEREDVLRRTALLLPDPVIALDAAGEYFKRWPAGPERRDVDVAFFSALFVAQVGLLQQGKFEADGIDAGRLATEVDKGLPLLLTNGLATAARIATRQKRPRARGWFGHALRACAVILDALHRTAEQEARSLLIGGEPRAEAEKIGNDALLEMAEPAYAAYTNGDLETALAGFTRLKQLNPYDGYARNVLGSILLKQKNHKLALQELLYGFSCHPTDLDLTRNLLTCLSWFTLYPAVLEVARHHARLRGNIEDDLIRPWVALARTCCAATAVQCAQCQADDISPDAPDVLEQFVDYPDHPWMPAHLFAVNDVLYKAQLFISYRRSGAGEAAKRLQATLRERFSSARIFRDSSLEPGVDFVSQLRQELDTADVLLALIDADWSGRRRAGKSRLLDPNDVLRREIARAIEHEIPIVPILLDGASMPSPEELPAEIADIRQLHALTLTGDGFDEQLEHILGEAAKKVVQRAVRKVVFEQELEAQEELEQRDPAQAEEKLRQLTRPGIEKLMKVMFETATAGRGVPSEDVELEGSWECTFTGSTGQASLLIDVHKGAKMLFNGTLSKKKGAVAELSPGDEEVRGAWYPIYDEKRPVLLGLFLDGLKDGLEFKIRIPFDRQVGLDLVGKDAEGITFVSRNVAPRPGGF